MRYFFAFWLVLTSVATFSQPVRTPRIIHELLNIQGEVPVINGGLKNLIPKQELPPALWNNDQLLFKTKNHLYLSIRGTGRLYDLSDSLGYLRCNRIDSTFYCGTNFESASFVWHNRLYDYAGYGFWAFNGIMRVFNEESRDWNLVFRTKQVEPNFPFNNSYQLSADNQSLYFSSYNIYNIDSGEQPIENKNSGIYSLNLNTGIVSYSPVPSWTRWLAALHQSEAGKQLFSTDFGILLGNYSPQKTTTIFYVLDFANKKIYQAKSGSTEKLMQMMAIGTDVAFYKDSTLYIGQMIGDKLMKIHLTLNDFEQSYPENRENPVGKKSRTELLLAGIGLLALLGYGAMKLFSGKKAEADKEKNQNDPLVAASLTKESISESSWIPEFSVLELQLIKFFWERSQERKPVSPEEINKLVGVHHKTEATQKKVRSEMIQSINSKWAARYPESGENLIMRQRNKQDMRMFDYFLNNRFKDQIPGIL